MVEREELTRHGDGLGTEIIIPRITSNIYVRRPAENLVLPPADKLVADSRNELKDAFGRDFEVPHPPIGLFATLKGFAELGIKRFDEVYFLPGMQLEKGSEFWNRFVRPVDSFWKQIETGNYPAKVAELEDGWFIGDRREAQLYSNGRKRYGVEDYMEGLMGHLRSISPDDGGIKKYPYVLPDSRFGVNPLEIEQIILPTFKEISGAKGTVRVRRFMEFTVRSNIAHPWVRDSKEWFADPVRQGKKRLAGGNFGRGGVVQVDHYRVDYRRNAIGFSPVVFFPTKPR